MPNRTEKRNQPPSRRDPAIQEFLDGLDRDIRAERSCPVCGANDWHAVATPVSFDTAQGGLQTEMKVVMLVCRRCRFIRLHLLNPLAEIPK